MMMLRLEVDRLRINMFLAEEFIRSSIAYGDENILRNAPALRMILGALALLTLTRRNVRRDARPRSASNVVTLEHILHNFAFACLYSTAGELKGSKASQSQTDIFPFRSLYKSKFIIRLFNYFANYLL